MTTKQLQHHIAYMKIAETIGNLSYCVRKKVGSIIVKDNNIISTGYNGTPSSMPNVCENDGGETNWWVLHSESNAITKLVKSTQSSDNSILYLTLSPCKDCAKLILQAGIKEVYFLRRHSCNEGIAFLTVQGVICYHLQKEIKNTFEEGGNGSDNYVINTYEKYTCEFINPLKTAANDKWDLDWELINSVNYDDIKPDTKKFFDRDLDKILKEHEANELLEADDNLTFVDVLTIYVPNIFNQEFKIKLFEKFDNIYDIHFIDVEEYSNSVLNNHTNLFQKNNNNQFRFKSDYPHINNFIKELFTTDDTSVKGLHLTLDTKGKPYILDKDLSNQTKRKIYIPNIFSGEFKNKLFNEFIDDYDIQFFYKTEDRNLSENDLFKESEDGRFHFKPKYNNFNKLIKSMFNNEPELVINNYLYLDSHDSEKDYIAQIPNKMGWSNAELKANKELLKVEAAGLYGTTKDKETILIHDCLPDELNELIINKLFLKYNIEITNNQHDFNNENQLFCVIENFLHFKTPKNYINFKVGGKFNDVVKIIVEWFDLHNNKFDDFELSYIIKPVEMQKSEKIFYLLTTNNISLIKDDKVKSLILIHDILPKSLIKSLKKKYDKNGCYKIEVTTDDNELNDSSQLFEAEILLDGNRKIFRFHIKSSIYFDEIKKDIINFYGFHQNEYEGYELKKKYDEKSIFKYYLEYERLLTIEELSDLSPLKDSNKSLLDEIRLEDTTIKIILDNDKFNDYSINFWRSMPSYLIPDQYGTLKKNPFYNNGSTNDSYHQSKNISTDFPYNFNHTNNLSSSDSYIINKPLKALRTINDLVYVNHTENNWKAIENKMKIGIGKYLFSDKTVKNLQHVFGDILYFYEDLTPSNTLVNPSAAMLSTLDFTYWHLLTIVKDTPTHVYYEFNLKSYDTNLNKELNQLYNFLVEYFLEDKEHIFYSESSPFKKIMKVTKP